MDRHRETPSGRRTSTMGAEASKQGIPYFQLEGDELQRELDTFKKL